jgi:hypothetical protein
MKTKLSYLRFAPGNNMSGLSTKKMSMDDDDFDDEDDNPWICCRCSSANDGDAGVCNGCGHDRCTHCSEIK